MNKYFIIGDVHGRLDMLTYILRDWKPDKEKLVLLGDYVDYGPDAYGTVREVKSLVNKYGAIALKGNHEKDFADSILLPDTTGSYERDLKRNRRMLTLKSFLGDEFDDVDTFDEMKSLIINSHLETIKFLDELPLYHETDSFIMSHAGINLSLSDWKTDEQAMLNGSRSLFIRTANKTGKIVVFGHSRTGVIRGMNNGASESVLYSLPFLDDRVWIDNSGTKLGIDGGNVFGGFLHGVHVSDDSDYIKTTSINQNKDRSHTTYLLDSEYKRLIV